MYKKLLCTILLFILITVNALVCYAQVEYENIDVPVPPHILFLGDSIVTGYGLEGYDTGKENCRSYSNIIADEYTPLLSDSCGFTMDNLAIDGQTSSQLNDAIANGKYDEYFEKTDCVVISIGGNDMLGVIIDAMISVKDNFDSWDNLDFNTLFATIQGATGKIDANLTTFDKNLVSIITAIKTKTSAPIIVQTLYNPIDGYKFSALDTLAQEKIDSLNNMITTHSTDSGNKFIVCNVADDFVGKASELTRIDEYDIHPNEQGHETIAKCIDETIRTQKYTYQKEIPVSAQPIESPEKKDNQTAAIIVIVVICVVFLLFIIKIFISKKVNKRKQEG